MTNNGPPSPEDIQRLIEQAERMAERFKMGMNKQPPRDGTPTIEQLARMNRNDISSEELHKSIMHTVVQIAVPGPEVTIALVTLLNQLVTEGPRPEKWFKGSKDLPAQLASIPGLDNADLENIKWLTHGETGRMALFEVPFVMLPVFTASVSQIMLILAMMLNDKQLNLMVQIAERYAALGVVESKGVDGEYLEGAVSKDISECFYDLDLLELLRAARAEGAKRLWDDDEDLVQEMLKISDGNMAIIQRAVEQLARRMIVGKMKLFE